MKLIHALLISISILMIGAVVAYAGWKASYSELDTFLSPTDAVLVLDQGASATKYIEAHNLYTQEVVAKTSAYTMETNDSGRTFTNTGATASVTLTCPECDSGLEGWSVSVINLAGYAIVIDPNANDSFCDQSDGEAGEYISLSSTKGSQTAILCVKEANSGTEDDEYNWTTQGYVGTITTED